MSGSVNKVILIGRFGRDADIRHTPSGKTVASISLATDESYKDKNGNKVEKTEWHKLNVWGKQAEFVQNFLGKGRLVYVEGKLETRSWDDNGVTRYSTEIRVDVIKPLDPKPKTGDAPSSRNEFAPPADDDFSYSEY